PLTVNSLFTSHFSRTEVDGLNAPRYSPSRRRSSNCRAWNHAMLYGRFSEKRHFLISYVVLTLADIPSRPVCRSLAKPRPASTLPASPSATAIWLSSRLHSYARPTPGLMRNPLLLPASVQLFHVAK